MASIRKKLEENANDSKNTRMDIASGNMLGNWRPDEITHMTRYDKISSLCIELAKQLGRPIDVLEAGCGEIWVLRNLYKAYTVKKSDVIRSYRGVDIDPACLNEKSGYSSPTGFVPDSTWFANFNGQIDIQDLTTNPIFDMPDNSVDFFWTTEVIEHMGSEFISAWLDDANRVLRPGGLIYVSTPNHDGSNDKLPEDHVYEWGFDELKKELTKAERQWYLQSVVGTFCQMPKLRAAMQKDKDAGTERWTFEQFNLLQERYGKQFLRVTAATFFPEVSNNCAWVLRKKP